MQSCTSSIKVTGFLQLKIFGYFSQSGHDWTRRQSIVFREVNVEASEAKWAFVAADLHSTQWGTSLGGCLKMFLWLKSSRFTALNADDGSFVKHLFLEFHTDCVGFLQEDGVAPQLIPEGGELVETPLSKCPQSQFGLSHSPRHWVGRTQEVWGHLQRIKQTQDWLRLANMSGLPSSSGSSSSSGDSR